MASKERYVFFVGIADHVDSVFSPSVDESALSYKVDRGIEYGFQLVESGTRAFLPPLSEGYLETLYAVMVKIEDE